MRESEEELEAEGSIDISSKANGRGQESSRGLNLPVETFLELDVFENDLLREDLVLLPTPSSILREAEALTSDDLD